MVVLISHLIKQKSQTEKKQKLSNKYVTFFFGAINNKNNKKLNISFVTKKKIGNCNGINK